MNNVNSIRSKKQHDPTEVLVGIGAIVVLALVWFQWDIIEVITPFLMPAYWLLILGSILTLAVASVVQAFMRPMSPIWVSRLRFWRFF